MIVGRTFEFDDNELLKSVQHDEYGHNVAKFFSVARLELVRAADIFTVDLLIVEKAKEVEGVDHRVLQDAHDIVAAAYRYHHDDGGQQSLLGPTSDQYSEYAFAWNRWFSIQLDNLTKNPELVRPAIECVVFANTELGYMAEQALCKFLIAYYRMGEWSYSDGYRKTYA